jgi:hypothetical protein
MPSGFRLLKSREIKKESPSLYFSFPNEGLAVFQITFPLIPGNGAKKQRKDKRSKGGTGIAYHLVNFFRGGHFMKIAELLQQVASLPNSGKKEKPESSGLDFQDLLSDAASKLGGSGQDLTSAALQNGEEMLSNSVSSVYALNNVQGATPVSDIVSHSIQATEKALNALEQYQKGMADPQIPLKKIEPLAQSLSQQVDQLNSLSDQLPASNPLKSIIQEVGVVSSVELEKFRRGDYV